MITKTTKKNTAEDPKMNLPPDKYHRQQVLLSICTYYQKGDSNLTINFDYHYNCTYIYKNNGGPEDQKFAEEH